MKNCHSVPKGLECPKAFEKQTKQQGGFIESLDFFNKKDKLKQIEGIFSHNFMNELIRIKLKEIINYKILFKKMQKNFANYLLPFVW